MEEIFKPVPFENFADYYSISNFGRLRVDVISKYSNNQTRFLKLHTNPKGYYFFVMTRNGKTVERFIHRTVAMTFCKKENESHNIVCHLDDNKLNNRSDNLIWGDHQINMDHMVERGRSLRGSKNPLSKVTEDQVKEIRKLYKETKISQQKLAERYGIDQTVVSRIILHKSWKHVKD